MNGLLERVRGALVGLKMPRALEALDHTLHRLEQGEITALAEMPDGYLLRFDGTRLKGGPGLALSAAAGTASGTGRLTSFVLTPGPEPSLRADRIRVHI